MSTTIDDTTLAPAHRTEGSFLTRLTTGTGAFNVLGKRRYYYTFSAVLVLMSLLFIVLRGFNFSIDFVGGNQLTFTPPAHVDQSQVQDVFNKAANGVEATIQTIGQKGTIQITSGSLSQDQTTAVVKALTTTFHLTASNGVSSSAVSGTWGSEISSRAVLAVLIFLVAVGLFIWIRYEKRVAIGAVGATIHDVVVTAGIYSAVGFQVSPATVIGLLTILGFSLYDTVVVYDKVQENTKGLTSLTRRTYPEAANLAVNQTLMRSINTSLIALLPVAGLLVAGVAILGSGTLKDLSLVLLVGMLVGAYSSMFVAVPLAVDLKIREPRIKAHTAKVVAKRKHDGLIVDADGDPMGRKDGFGVAFADREAEPVATGDGVRKAVAPKPGAKPVRPGAKAGAKVAEKVTSAAKATADSSPVVDAAAASQGVLVNDAESVIAATSSSLSPSNMGGRSNSAAAGKSARQVGKSGGPTGKRGR